MIKLSIRDTIPYVRSSFGHFWIENNGNEHNLYNMSHRQFALNNVSKMFPNWEKQFNKKSINIMSDMYGEKEEQFLMLSGWIKVDNDSFITTESGVAKVRDFIIKCCKNFNVDKNKIINLRVYRNDLSGFVFGNKGLTVEEFVND